MKNYMKLEIAALSENESFARSAVAAFALSLNPTLLDLSDIKTAVSEAVTNCIVHAYHGCDETQKIVIECQAEKNTFAMKKEGVPPFCTGILHIQITDYGRGIDDLEMALTPFYTTLEDEERSGMGFTIMQTFMDDFSIDSQKGKGTTVCMTKKISIAENDEIRKRANA